MPDMLFALACPQPPLQQQLTEEQFQELRSRCSNAQGVPFDLVLVYDNGSGGYQAFLAVSAQVYQDALSLIDSGELVSRPPPEAPRQMPEPEPEPIPPMP